MENSSPIPNLIFYSAPILAGKGGPSGYLANLMAGFKKESIDIPLINSPIRPLPCEKIIRAMIKWFCMFIPVHMWRKNSRRFLVRQLARWIERRGVPPLPSRLARQLDALPCLTLTCHSIDDFISLHAHFRRRKQGTTPKFILMSHCPEAPSLEKYRGYRGEMPAQCLEVKYQQWKKEERYAFEQSDYLLFPSPESVEPYCHTLPYFSGLLPEKQVLYLPTGTLPVAGYSPYERDSLKQKFAVNTPCVLSFIGRHLEVKGYNFLLSLGEKILSRRDDITILVGGKSEPGSPPPLQHPRWKEIGWINPAEVFAVSDIFILPNKETYFDLILLEALSAGTYVLASRTGGNISVDRITQDEGGGAIKLFNNEIECLQLIDEYLNAPSSYKEMMSTRSRLAYENHFTVSHFASGYLKLIQSLTRDQL